MLLITCLQPSEKKLVFQELGWWRERAESMCCGTSLQREGRLWQNKVKLIPGVMVICMERTLPSLSLLHEMSLTAHFWFSLLTFIKYISLGFFSSAFLSILLLFVSGFFRSWLIRIFLQPFKFYVHISFICFTNSLNLLTMICNFCSQRRSLNISHFQCRIAILVG